MIAYDPGDHYPRGSHVTMSVGLERTGALVDRLLSELAEFSDIIKEATLPKPWWKDYWVQPWWPRLIPAIRNTSRRLARARCVTHTRHDHRSNKQRFFRQTIRRECGL